MEGLISRNFTVFFMSFSPSDILRTHNLLVLQFARLGQQIEGYQLFRRKVVLIQVVSKQVY